MILDDETVGRIRKGKPLPPQKSAPSARSIHRWRPNRLYQPHNKEAREMDAHDLEHLEKILQDKPDEAYGICARVARWLLRDAKRWYEMAHPKVMAERDDAAVESQLNDPPETI